MTLQAFFAQGSGKDCVDEYEKAFYTAQQKAVVDEHLTAFCTVEQKRLVEGT